MARSSSPPYARCTSPNDPVQGLLPPKLFPHVTGGVPNAVSRFTAHVTVIGQGPAWAGMLIVNVRVVLFGLLSLPPPLQLPPAAAVSRTLVRSDTVEAKLTVRVAEQLALL